MHRLRETIFKNQQYERNLMGLSFENLCRQATAKTLKQPSDSAVSEVLLAVNEDSSGALFTQELISVLRKRLRSFNPQKQYLAVHLASKIMMQCTLKVRAVNRDILLEVARVAAKPSKPGTPAANRAKTLALEVLRSHGQAGKTAFSIATGLGKNLRWVSEQEPTVRTDFDQCKDTWEQDVPGKETEEYPTLDLIQQLKQATDMSNSHSQRLNDMLENTPPDQLAEDPVDELLSEIEQLQKMMHILIQQATSRDNAAVQLLLDPAFEALDGMNAVVMRHKSSSEEENKERQQQQQQRVFHDRSVSFSLPYALQSQSAQRTTSTSLDEVAFQSVFPDPFGLDRLEQGLEKAFADLVSQQVQVPPVKQSIPFGSRNALERPPPLESGISHSIDLLALDDPHPVSSRLMKAQTEDLCEVPLPWEHTQQLHRVHKSGVAPQTMQQSVQQAAAEQAVHPTSQMRAGAHVLDPFAELAAMPSTAVSNARGLPMIPHGDLARMRWPSTSFSNPQGSQPYNGGAMAKAGTAVSTAPAALDSTSWKNINEAAGGDGRAFWDSEYTVWSPQHLPGHQNTSGFNSPAIA